MDGSAGDFRDMLGLEGQGQAPSQGRGRGPSTSLESILNGEKKKKPKKINKLPPPGQFKKPDGMARELFNLLRDGSGGLSAPGMAGNPMERAPLLQTDSKGGVGGYKKFKAKLSKFQPRAWKLTPFTVPMRSDSMVFFHWKRECDEPKEYPFARFDIKANVPMYTNADYFAHLVDRNWTKEETDYMMGLCRRFDARFIVVQDRYDVDKYGRRSVEDIKERYYKIMATLEHVRGGPEVVSQASYYDAAHERRRKAQLEKLWNRTPEQVKEEEKLIEELKKIESRKREREKKAQDLQKLISAVDSRTGVNKTSSSSTKSTKVNLKDNNLKRTASAAGLTNHNPKSSSDNPITGIKWPEIKPTGSTIRSYHMKLPATLGQKKSKAIEQLLVEYGLEVWPHVSTAEIVTEFNDLRSDLAILYELNQANEALDFELQTLTHKHNALKSAKH